MLSKFDEHLVHKQRKLEREHAGSRLVRVMESRKEFGYRAGPPLIGREA